MERVGIAIVGSGPAGISAALNAQIRHKSFYLFGSGNLSDKVQRSEQIANVPAIGVISGAELNERFAKHIDEAGITVTQKHITGIYPMGDYFALLANQDDFYANSVILATGVETIKPLRGEREFLGRGVSYCATCDGNLYQGKTIAVICDNAPMEEEAAYLAGLAQKVYYLPLFQNSKLDADHCERLSSPIVEILGDQRVSAIRCKDEQNIAVDGVFFLKHSISPAVLLTDLNMEQGHVAVDRHMATNIKGCFAAGDCTGTPYQITKSLGEGNIAAHAAFAYLAQQNR